jgi:hypothetical protein
MFSVIRGVQTVGSATPVHALAFTVLRRGLPSHKNEQSREENHGNYRGDHISVETPLWTDEQKLWWCGKGRRATVVTAVLETNIEAEKGDSPSSLSSFMKQSEHMASANKSSRTRVAHPWHSGHGPSTNKPEPRFANPVCLQALSQRRGL